MFPNNLGDPTYRYFLRPWILRKMGLKVVVQGCAAYIVGFRVLKIYLQPRRPTRSKNYVDTCRVHAGRNLQKRRFLGLSLGPIAD